MATQENRPMRLKTALGPDALLLTQFQGHETLSKLFEFELEALAPSHKPADFSKLLGQPVSVEIDSENKTRYFHGIVSRCGQGRRDAHFIHYQLVIVPHVWVLTCRSQSRIFQQITIPDILKKVFQGFKVKWELKGNYQPRDYCVQYRETDFAFASRLMEEEGIWYCFTHDKSGIEMLVADTPMSHAEVPINSKLIYEDVRGGTRPDTRVYNFHRWQKLLPAKVTLWDHCFELPHEHLQAEKKVTETVKVGKVQHKLQLGSVTDLMEQYEYPGGYAQRFDGVDPGGGDRADDLQNIFKDNARTATIRAQEWESNAVMLQGASNAPQLTAGHKFELTRHPDADDTYVVREVSHLARMTSNYRSGEGELVDYSNQFWCIPLAVPFRPLRETPRPVINGTQTAVVTGPPGEEIFTDKYGRVKVQFHWDREGKLDANSSCWVRVATIWAGKTWGVIHIPRIGQEVVVAFEEGDPDRPLIVGSVYNADQMPPGKLPDDKMVSGSRTNSTPGGGGFNGIMANDTKGNELVAVHAQFNMDTVVEHDQTTTVHNNRTDVIDADDSETVKGNQTQHVVKDQTINIDANRTETVGINESITIGGNRTRSVSGNETVTVTMTRTHTVGVNEAITVGGAQEVTIGGMQALSIGGLQNLTVGRSQTVSIGSDQTISVGGKHTESITGNSSQAVGGDASQTVKGNRSGTIEKDDKLKVTKKLLVDVGEEIVFKTGDASITMKKNGNITIKGKDIMITGSGKITAKANGDVKIKGSKIGEN